MLAAFLQKYNNKLIIIAFTLFYLFFPNHNSTIDAYNYAANIKWNHDLFFPHHLLYNIPARIVYSFFQTFGFEVDVLQLMKNINAIVAGLVLSVFVKILNKLPVERKTITGLLLISGSSFGFLRFATENEAYILPLFASVLSSYYFLLFLIKEKNVFLILSGFFASLACLFHQIHLFWFIGLLVGLLIKKRRIASILYFLLPSFLIPLIYIMAYKYGNNTLINSNSLFSYILYDYFYGTAHVHFDLNNIILGFISFIRSFIQVHGIIIILLKKHSIFIIPIMFSAYFLVKAILHINIRGKKEQSNQIFIQTHFIIFILQLVFAIFAGGNAEFMVMLPLLSLLVIAGNINLNPMFYKTLGISLLIWNFSFALFPNYFKDYQHDTKMIDFIKTHPFDYFILSEEVLIQNKIYYQSGIPWNDHLLKSPAGHKINNSDLTKLQTQIDSLLIENTWIYTDCLDEPVLYNRAAYLSADVNNVFFKEFKLNKTDSFETFAGKKYIYRIVE